MRREFEVVVVGAGPAGIAAATRAAEAGRVVGIVDDNPIVGGQIWRAYRGQGTPDDSHGGGAGAWYRRLRATSAEVLPGWSVFAADGPGELLAEREGERMALRYERLVLATGARELFLPFPGWTLPNVFGVGGLQAMMKAGLPMRGKRVVVAGSGPLLLAVAAALGEAGAKVARICEQTPMGRLLGFGCSLVTEPGKLLQAVRYRGRTMGARFRTGCWPVEARGDGQVQSVVLSYGGGRAEEIACDYLACAFHLVPNAELASALGCRMEGEFVAVDGLQRTSVEGVLCAGEPTGIAGLELSLLEGEIAGLAAAGGVAEAERLARRRRAGQAFARRLGRTFALRAELRELPRAETVVCRCEDVPFGRLAGQRSWREAKLQTRCGMGPCQGRICSPATKFLFGWPETTEAQSVRPPILPVQVGSLAAAGLGFEVELTEKEEIP